MPTDTDIVKKITNSLRINLNQNVWLLAVSLVSLGTSEYFCLRTLFCFSAILSFLTLVSVAVTLYAYTVNYYYDKMNQK